MSLQEIRLADIRASHLAQLIEAKSRETKVIEYKRELPSGRRADKIEFLKDITSFANTIGGDLVYGMEARAGIPVALPGLPTEELDAEQLRLSGLLEHSVDPRLVGLDMHEVAVGSGRSCLIIRVPRSLDGPHVVDHDGHWRFWARNAAGKYELDVGELRRAFSVRESLANRVRSFRAERLALIRANEGPLTLVASSALVLHLAPLSAADGVVAVDFKKDYNRILNAGPSVHGGGLWTRINGDGQIVWEAFDDRTKTTAYSQVFRTGAIELVHSGIIVDDKPAENTTHVPLDEYESDIRIFVQRYMALLQDLGVSPPIFLMLSLLGVKGAYVDTPWHRSSLDSYPFDRDVVLSPDVMFESASSEMDAVLRPALDALWNAGGYANSPNYDNDGSYRRRRR